MKYKVLQIFITLWEEDADSILTSSIHAEKSVCLATKRTDFFFQGGQTCQLIANFVPSLSSIETS